MTRGGAVRLLVSLSVLAWLPSTAEALLTAPTTLTARVVSSSAIALTWVDSNTTEIGFGVERSLDGSTFSQVGTAGLNATSYQDGGLAGGVRYYYRVRALGSSNKTSTYSNVTSAVTTESIPPSVPTGLLGSALSCSQISLSWKASTDTGGSGLKGYNVYAWRNSTWTLLKQVLAPTISTSDGSLAPLTAYYYSVAAVDNAGNLSALSGWISVSTVACVSATTTTVTSSTSTTTDTTPPSIPTGLSASVASCSQINLFWNASTDIGSGIRGYNLYGWRNATWTFLKQVLSPATSTFNGGLSGSTLYYYSVASVDNAGHTSGLSAFVSATTSACGTATTTTTIRATTTTTLANRAPVANGGSNVTGAVGLPVSLNDAASYDPDAGDWIASYKWTFGDGTPSVTYTTAGTVTHTYTAAGTYNAVLTVTDSHGAMSSVTVVASVGALSGAKGQFMWNRHVLASSGLDSSGFLGVARDSAGNVVAVGSGGRNINWGSGVSGGELSDALIIKYSATGSLVWAKRLPSNNDSMNAVAIDASDNIVVTGGFQDSIDFGAGPLTSVGSSDFFLAKYSSSGALLWARQFGGLMVETGRGVVVDQTGNIFVVGFFSGTTSFGGGSLTAPSGGGVFLAKYSPTGAHLWSKSFSGGSQQPGAIAIDGNGNIAVVGNFSGTVNFGGGSLTSAGGTDVFVAEYSSSGAHLWSRRGGGSGADLGYGIAIGPTGNVVAVGAFMGTANFGGSSFVSGGGTNDIFVAQYSSTGTHLWSKSFGGELTYGSDTAKAVTVDGSGNVIFTGNIQGPVDFGGGPLIANNTGDIFVTKLNSNGGYLWAKRAGGDTDYDNGNDVMTDASGNVIVAGAFTLTCDFGGGALTSPWGDALVVKFGP